MTKYKYAIPTMKDQEVVAQIFQEYPMRSGFYNWAKVMKADMMPYEKLEPEDYDVVHVNMAPTNWWFILELQRKLKNSSTKLILNNDHVSEHWYKWNWDINLYEQIQEGGDVVFGTEPYQTSQMIDRAVCMPHPSAIKEMKIFSNKFKKGSEDRFGMFFHHYDQTLVQSALLSRTLKKDTGMKSCLYNHVPRQTSNPESIYEAHFDKLYKQFEFPQFCMNLMRNKFMVELAQYHTYGRATVETAACKIPTIGSDRVDSMQRNFPFTCTDPLNHRKIREFAKHLEINNFRKKVTEHAYYACEYYNYKNCKERMRKLIEGVRK